MTNEAKSKKLKWYFLLNIGSADSYIKENNKPDRLLRKKKKET